MGKADRAASVSSTINKGYVESSIDESSAIDVHKLVKRYPKVPVNAVDEISFSVRRGEIFGLLGPNGAGKTTTISMLTSNMLPTSGTITIMGIDMLKNPAAAKRHIAVVPQRSNLDQSLNARDILLFHAAYHNVPRSIREARADKLLEELGLRYQAKQKLNYYSGGMAQRLMLARALMHSPDALFLDEPTNSLDPQSRLFLWERMRILRENGMSVLLTTHDMVEAEQLCDRIAIMDHGRILVLNTASELKKLVPGGTALEVGLRIPERFSENNSGDARFHSSMLEVLRGALPDTAKIEEVSPEARTQQGLYMFRVRSEDSGALINKITRAIADAGVELCDLHLTHPGLEDVFIHLTGRNLRS